MSTDENPPAPKIEAEHLFQPGSIAERVELQLGVLTQGVVDCMILATGAYPMLTEGPVAEPNAFAKPKAAGLSSYQSARSAELRDAARLSEASARLLTGFAKLRAQFSQDFTIRHNEKRKAGDAKNRLRNTTITQRFSVPGREAVSIDSVDPKTTAKLTRGLAKMAEGLNQKTTAQRTEKGDALRAELFRRYSRAPKGDGKAPGTDDAPPSGTPPPPSPGR
ncbi:MAG TPA: hypothetical protein VII56_18055 [Rhizomicrobium sp.]